jgi:hypothetical protein
MPIHLIPSFFTLFTLLQVYLLIYLFAIYLTTLSLAKNIQP